MEIAIGNMITSSSQMNGAIASGGGGDETKFVIEVTINDGDASGDRDFTFYSQGSSPNYNIDWGDGDSDTGVTANSISHTYPENKTYEIKIDGTFGINMGTALLVDRAKLTKLKNWGTSEAQLLSLYQAFMGCSNMTYEATDYPDLTNLDTGNHRKLQKLFDGCTSITSLDLSNWQNTSNITSFSSTFSNVKNTTSVNITGWDTSNITTFINVFKGVGYDSKNAVITAPDLDLTSCTSAGTQTMFTDARCTSIDVSGWTFNSGTNYDLFRAFYRTWVATIDLSTWVNCKISRAKGMFRDVENLTTLNITGLDFTPNTDLEAFVKNADALTTFTGISGLVTTNNLDAQVCFNGLKVYDWSNENLRDDKFNANFGSTTNMNSMFSSVGFTTPTPPPNIANLDTSGVTSMNQCFNSSKFTSTLDLSGWDMSANTNLYRFLHNNDGITSIDASSWAFTNSLTTMKEMIRGSEVTDITFGSSSDFSGITDFQNFSLGCLSLTSIDFPTNADFSSVTIMTNFMGNTETNMSTAEYDNFLVRFDATNSNSGMTLSFGQCQYTSGGAAATAHASIIAKGNTIIDDGGCCFSNTLSVEFDGVDDYVNCGNPTELQITGNLSISFWFKTSSASNMRVAGKDGGAASNRNYITIISGGLVSFQIWKSNFGVAVSTTSTYNDGNWHHAVAVNDGSDLKIYIDGSLENTNVGGGGTIDNDVVNFEIGRRSLPDRYFDGNLDEVAVFNTALSSVDVTTIYNSGSPDDLSSLNPVLWYRMGDGDTYPTLTDRGSGGNNGTMTNMASGDIVSDVP